MLFTCDPDELSEDVFGDRLDNIVFNWHQSVKEGLITDKSSESLYKLICKLNLYEEHPEDMIVQAIILQPLTDLLTTMPHPQHEYTRWRVTKNGTVQLLPRIAGKWFQEEHWSQEWREELADKIDEGSDEDMPFMLPPKIAEAVEKAHDGFMHGDK